MEPIEALTKILSKLPGVGPRQARRFAYALTRQNSSLGNELSNILYRLKNAVYSCELCGATKSGDGPICHTCSRDNRDPKTLTLVTSQEDYDSLLNIESYRGMLAIAPFPPKIEMINNIESIINSHIPHSLEYWSKKGLEEIIIAFPISPEGEIMETLILDYLEKELGADNKITISNLGRGMSLGSRLSDTDDETIRYALSSRKRAI